MLDIFRISLDVIRSYFDCNQDRHFQVIACGSHWTPGMHTMTTKAMNAPLIFIASCMEAAIYGKMKLNVQHGTPQEMNAYLVKTVREKQLGRTMIFCRSPAEVLKVKQMLGQVKQLKLSKLCLFLVFWNWNS